MITGSASIAVVATTSALLAKPLADLLLKVVKPVVKVKKVATLRGRRSRYDPRGTDCRTASEEPEADVAFCAPTEEIGLGE